MPHNSLSYELKINFFMWKLFYTYMAEVGHSGQAKTEKEPCFLNQCVLKWFKKSQDNVFKLSVVDCVFYFSFQLNMTLEKKSLKFVTEFLFSYFLP